MLRAEGDKQQRILRAEGESEAIQRVAEAERFRQETIALGEAQAINSVYGAINDNHPDPSLLTIKYLETLQTMADGRATKIVVPTELAGLAGSLTAITELLGNGSPRAARTTRKTPGLPPDGRPDRRHRAVDPAVRGIDAHAEHPLDPAGRRHGAQHDGPLAPAVRGRRRVRHLSRRAGSASPAANPAPDLRRDAPRGGRVSRGTT